MANTDYPHRDATTLLSASDAFVQALDASKRPVINAEPGGQYGWAGNVFAYVSTQPHVSQQGYCITLSTPAMFSKLPGGARLHGLCKSFFENRTISFEGLKDSTEHSFGKVEWTGHTLSVPTGSTRTLGAVTHVANDVVGEPFTKMFKIWGTWGINDPELQMAKMVILPDPGDMLLDVISASNCYFEPTHNMQDVAHCAVNVGMMPLTTVPIELKRDKSEEGTLRKIEMEFTGVVEFDTLAAMQIGRTLMKLMPLFNPDARDAPEGFKDRTSTVTGLTQAGTIENMTLQKATITTGIGTASGSAGGQYLG